MDDIQLQEAIERYLTGDMSAQEATQFESIRKRTPEIDQMVVEHEMFMRQIDQYAGRKNFSIQSEQVFSRLYNQGFWTPEEEQSTMYKVIQLWDKYKKVTAIAASVGGFIALFTSALIVYLSPSLNGNQLLQLSKAVEVIKKNQQVQGHILNEVKTKIPENAKLVSGGSGFLIDTKGFIITNAHVLKGNSAIVINSKGQELNASIVYSDLHSDLAILKIEDQDYQQVKSIPYTIRKKISNLGEEIFTLGFPRNDNDIVYGKGYLSAQSGFDGDSNSYQIQISANPGNSGAPIFNDNAELIGVITTRQKQAEGVAFAVKSSKIFDMVRAIEAQDSTHSIALKLPKHTNVRGDRKDKISNLKDYMFSVRSFN
jgi:S1-C subfamily serine protease